MEEKYIKLLVDKCLTLKKDDALFISYPLIIRDFVWKLVSYVKKIGIKDIDNSRMCVIPFTRIIIRRKILIFNNVSHQWFE